MLVVSRKLNEAVKMTIPAGTLVTEDMKIDVTVIRVGLQIRIGIEAPKVVGILRGELVAANHAGKEEL